MSREDVNRSCNSLLYRSVATDFALHIGQTTSVIACLTNLKEFSVHSNFKFSVQLVSIEDDQFQLAVSLMSRLLHAGHYAYLHRTDAEFDGKFWYRVRVGFFKNLEDALTTGKKIFEKFKDEELFSENFMPVQPGPQELSRPVIDLRQPLNKPWVIELPLYDVQNKALKDLAELNTEIDFSYISQKLKSASSGKLEYRIRIGFFETRREAGGTIYRLKKKFPKLKRMKRVRL
mgnify:CR=1 FL=1